jgi:hypothetical protein
MHGALRGAGAKEVRSPQRAAAISCDAAYSSRVEHRVWSRIASWRTREVMEASREGHQGASGKKKCHGGVISTMIS